MDVFLWRFFFSRLFLLLVIFFCLSFVCEMWFIYRFVMVFMFFLYGQFNKNACNRIHWTAVCCCCFFSLVWEEELLMLSVRTSYDLDLIHFSSLCAEKILFCHPTWDNYWRLSFTVRAPYFRKNILLAIAFLDAPSPKVRFICCHHSRSKMIYSRFRNTTCIGMCVFCRLVCVRVFGVCAVFVVIDIVNRSLRHEKLIDLFHAGNFMWLKTHR